MGFLKKILGNKIEFKQVFNLKNSKKICLSDVNNNDNIGTGEDINQTVTPVMTPTPTVESRPVIPPKPQISREMREKIEDLVSWNKDGINDILSNRINEETSFSLDPNLISLINSSPEYRNYFMGEMGRNYRGITPDQINNVINEFTNRVQGVILEESPVASEAISGDIDDNRKLELSKLIYYKLVPSEEPEEEKIKKGKKLGEKEKELDIKKKRYLLDFWGVRDKTTNIERLFNTYLWEAISNKINITGLNQEDGVISFYMNYPFSIEELAKQDEIFYNKLQNKLFELTGDDSGNLASLINKVKRMRGEGKSNFSQFLKETKGNELYNYFEAYVRGLNPENLDRRFEEWLKSGIKSQMGGRERSLGDIGVGSSEEATEFREQLYEGGQTPVETGKGLEGREKSENLNEDEKIMNEAIKYYFLKNVAILKEVNDLVFNPMANLISNQYKQLEEDLVFNIGFKEKKQQISLMRKKISDYNTVNVMNIYANNVSNQIDELFRNGKVAFSKDKVVYRNIYGKVEFPPDLFEKIFPVVDVEDNGNEDIEEKKQKERRNILLNYKKYIDEYIDKIQKGEKESLFDVSLKEISSRELAFNAYADMGVVKKQIKDMLRNNFTNEEIHLQLKNNPETNKILEVLSRSSSGQANPGKINEFINMVKKENNITQRYGKEADKEMENKAYETREKLELLNRQINNLEKEIEILKNNNNPLYKEKEKEKEEKQKEFKETETKEKHNYKTYIGYNYYPILGQLSNILRSENISREYLNNKSQIRNFIDLFDFNKEIIEMSEDSAAAINEYDMRNYPSYDKRKPEITNTDIYYELLGKVKSPALELKEQFIRERRSEKNPKNDWRLEAIDGIRKIHTYNKIINKREERIIEDQEKIENVIIRQKLNEGIRNIIKNPEEFNKKLLEIKTEDETADINKREFLRNKLTEWYNRNGEENLDPQDYIDMGYFRGIETPYNEIIKNKNGIKSKKTDSDLLNPKSLEQLKRERDQLVIDTKNIILQNIPDFEVTRQLNLEQLLKSAFRLNQLAIKLAYLKNIRNNSIKIASKTDIKSINNLINNLYKEIDKIFKLSLK